MGAETALVVALALAAGGGWLPAAHGLDNVTSTNPETAVTARPQTQGQGQAAAEIIVEVRFRGNYSIADEDLLAASGVRAGDPLTATTLADIERRLRDYEGIGSVEILKRYHSMANVRNVVLLVKGSTSPSKQPFRRPSSASREPSANPVRNK